MAAVQTQRMSAIGVFEEQADAQRAARALRAAGFNEPEIGVASKHRDVASDAEGTTKGTNVATGAAAGAATGAGVGALWGLGVIAGLLPAIGPVIAGGTLAAILASTAIGAGTATVAGALVGLGIPEEEAKYYESEFNSGRTIVSVKTSGARYTEAMNIMADEGAEDSRFGA